MQCANAAAAEWRKRPAYVTYHVDTTVSAPSMNKKREILRYVAARTSDDTAIVQDLPQGREQITHAFPLLPTFDAISAFTLTWQTRLHDTLESYIHDITPLEYTIPTAQTEHADVVVFRLRAYRASYAADSSEAPGGRTHLTMEPYQFVKDKASKDEFFLDDVVIDNATDLPQHVSYSGPDGLVFAVDYTTVDGHWVVNHTHYEQTAFAPLRLGMVHGIADARFDQFTFPASAPDPRLAG
jgi:hypothetical protein